MASETTTGTAAPLAFRLSLTGREDDAKNVELAGTDVLSPHVWEYLRSVKSERETFVLYDATRGRRLDPDWPCADAGIQPGALVMIGDPTDFPDPLSDYRASLVKVRQDRVWPISEETGAAMLEQRHQLAVTKLEHQSLARDAGLPPDDAIVLWDWLPLEERRREEYRILLNIARAKSAVPEAAVRKLAELRGAMAMTPEEHMDACSSLGIDPALAARLLEGGAPVPPSHLEYLQALANAHQADFSVETLSAMRDLVVKHRLTRDVHVKLATQAGMAPDLADASFEDRAGPVGRSLYKRELLAVNRRKVSDVAGLAHIKELRDRYAVRRAEHMRIASEWGVPEATATALWDLKPLRKGLTPRQTVIGFSVAFVILLFTPQGQYSLRMMWGGVVDAFQPASPYDAEGFDAKGFDRNGFDRRGYDRNGFDRAGYDLQGYDKTGYNRNGYDRALLDRKGRDKDGFDRDGFDVRGLDRKGFDRTGRDRDGFDTNGLDRNGYDRAGFNAQGLDKSGYNRGGRDKDGFDRGGLDAAGYDHKGFNRAGIDRKGFNREGRDKEGYDREGFDTNGFNREGNDKDGYDRSGYDKQGYDRGGLDRRGLDRQGNARPRGAGGSRPLPSGATPAPAAPSLGQDGYGPDGFDRAGRDRNGFDRAGFGRDGFNRQGRNRWGFDRAGLDANGYDRDGFNREGFNREGVDQRGFSREGVDKSGFDRQGFNKQGFDREGRSRDGTDLLPGNLASLQGESATDWVLRSGGSVYKLGSTVPPYGVRLERIGGNVVHFRHDGILYERKIVK